MKAIKFKLLLLAVIMIVAAVGCNKENVGDSSKEKETTNQEKDIPKEDYEKPLTREWIKETYKYTDEELDDYYVDEMINSGEWTIGRVEEEAGTSSEFYSLLTGNKIMYLHAHKDEIEAADAENKKLYSRAKLLEGTAFQGEIPDSSELKCYTLIEDDGKTPLSVLKVNLWNLVDAGHLTGVKK